MAHYFRAFIAFGVTAGALALAALAAEFGLPRWVAANTFVVSVVTTLCALYDPDALRSDRRAKGLCVHCGYDLRATPAPKKAPGAAKGGRGKR